VKGSLAGRPPHTLTRRAARSSSTSVFIFILHLDGNMARLSSIALVALVFAFAFAGAANAQGVPRPTTEAASGRGFRDSYYKEPIKEPYYKEPIHHACVGVEIAKDGETYSPCGKFDKCCDGFFCRVDAPLFAKLPYKEITGPVDSLAQATSNLNQCCIPEDALDVTELVCPAEFFDSTAGTCSLNAANNAGYTWAGIGGSALNELACLCCDGVIRRDGNRNNAKITCNDLGTGNARGTCPQPAP
jgi:hypothetical protein